MNLIKDNFNTLSPLPSIFLQEWKDILDGCDTVLFDNLDQFVYTVSKLTQKQDYTCNMTYLQALNKLKQRVSDFPESHQETIRNLVRQNLFKRGLITEEVYEDFKYTTDGTQVGIDVGKYASGDAECVITPSKQYIDYFYEMYINVSYPHYINNETVRNNVAKLLATVEELERQHIFVKINVLFPANNIKADQGNSKNNKFFSVIPVFSHKDFKSVDIMSSVVNDRLLRKFYFAILEEMYGDNLASNYGYAINLPKTMNVGDEFNEIEFFESVKNNIGI